MENHRKYVSPEELYKTYSKDILRYSFSILKDYQDAQDIVQEVFIRHFTNEKINEHNYDVYYESDFELSISLRDALKKLPSEYSELLYLKEAEGYSYIEISQITRLSVDNVAIRLHRAKQLLRKILKNRY